MRQLESYAKVLAFRVDKAIYRRRSGRKQAAAKERTTSPTLLRCLLAWTFRDQIAECASVVAKVDDDDDDDAVTLGGGGSNDEVRRCQLAPLFPPAIPWRLVETDAAVFEVTGVPECVGARASSPPHQEKIARRFGAFAARLRHRSYLASFASARLLVVVDGALVFDGPAPRRDSPLSARVDAMDLACRLDTGPGWARLALVHQRRREDNEDVLRDALPALFGATAAWRRVVSPQAQTTTTTTTRRIVFEKTPDLFSAETKDVLLPPASSSRPPANANSLGKQLVVSAALASSSSSKRKRIRVPTEDRRGAVEVGVPGLPVSAEWRTHPDLCGLDAPATFASSSLQAAYRPSSRRAVAVAASVTLVDAEAPSHAGGGGESLRARLDGVSVLPSVEWLALALRAGGFRLSSEKLATLPRPLVERADALADALHDLVDSGRGMTDPRAGRDLGAKLEALFSDLPAEEEKTNPVVEARSTDLGELRRLLSTPHRGDQVATPYGRGAARSARGDGSFVVDLAWGGVGYLRREDVALVARRGVLEATPYAEKARRRPVGGGGAAPTVIVPSARKDEDDASTASLGDTRSLGDTTTPTTPTPAVVEEDREEKERVKRWILEAASKTTTTTTTTDEPAPSKSRSSVVPDPRDQLVEFVERNPALCADKPLVVVRNASRWLAARDVTSGGELVRIVVAAFVAATSLDDVVRPSFPATSALRLVAQDDGRGGQRAVIDGVVLFAAVDQPSLLPRFALLLKALYDNDVLEEDAILRWAADDDASSTPPSSPALDDPHDQARAAAAPFLRWLREAESEPSSGEEAAAASSDDDDDGGDTTHQ